MRHARKAAASATMAVLATVALTASAAAQGQGADSTGGTPAPMARISARGTGGTEYVAVPATPRPVRRTVRRSLSPRKPRLRKPVSRRSVSRRPVTRKPVSHKPVSHKPTPPKPAPPAPSAPVPPPPAPIPPAPTVPAGVATPAQTVVEGAVFPVAGPHSYGDAANRFGAGREGHLHQGQDVLAAEGLPVLAPLGGTIITTGYQAGGAGWYVAEHTLDGLDFFFAHCQAGSLAVATGQAIIAGQTVCQVGQTGDATGPHLHLEIWIGGWRAPGSQPIDPLPYLEAWEAAGR